MESGSCLGLRAFVQVQSGRRRCARGLRSLHHYLRVNHDLGHYLWLCLSINRGDFQVEAKQLEDSGWLRAVGGIAVAPKVGAVTPP